MVSSYRLALCLASKSIQPKEGELLPQSLKADFGMTRAKENTGKDMRSQINKHLTPGERTFKLKEVTGQVYFISGGEEAGGLRMTSRRGA